MWFLLKSHVRLDVTDKNPGQLWVRLLAGDKSVKGLSGEVS